jgi:hypothetical protein
LSPTFGASEVKNSTPPGRRCHFPIAYQQEFFNQLTSEEVRTRFVRGHPVHYWFNPPARERGAGPARLCLGRIARASGPLGSPSPRRAYGTPAATAVTARRWLARPSAFIAAACAAEPLRAPAHTLQDEMKTLMVHCDGNDESFN